MLEADNRGEPVVVARSGGSLYAFEGWCTHEECPLAEGTLTDQQLECYCHGAVFNIRTGEALVGPAVAPLERDCLLRYCTLLRERLGGSLLRLALFGSAARGDMWDAGSPMHSDIDLLVVTAEA